MLDLIYQKILEYDTIIIHRHTKPDGDALGSQLGLKKALISTFPNKNVKVVGDVNEKFLWMGEMDIISDDLYKDALVIVVDTGSSFLISDERYKLAPYVIKIDHHIPQGEYGDIAYVDTSSESASGIVAKFCLDYNFKLNSEAASLLFTGIITDSGRFRYQSTTSNTFYVVSKLMEYDIDTEYIYNKIYQDHLKNVKLKGTMIEKFKTTPNGLAYLINTKEEIASYGISVNDVSRGMVSVMSGIEEISVWANFSEDVNGDIYCELRSSGKNVNLIATKYGGGGHLQASGCCVKSFDVVNDIIKDLDDLAKEDN